MRPTHMPTVARYSRRMLGGGRVREIQISAPLDRPPAARVSMFSGGTPTGAIVLLPDVAPRVRLALEAAREGRVGYSDRVELSHANALLLRVERDIHQAIGLSVSFVSPRPRRSVSSPVPLDAEEIDALDRALEALVILSADHAA